MDIIRRKNGKKFKYYTSKTKKLIVNSNNIRRINSLRIPPGYKNVFISKNKNSKVQATGIDTMNRKQYIYNPEYIKSQKIQKFKDLILFGKKIQRIRHDIKTNISNCYKNPRLITSKNSLISLILFLIDKCNFRVGCEKYKELYKTYGVTTLNKNHFKIYENFIDIEFIGKKGIKNKSRVLNKDICYLLKQICSINNGIYLFETNETNKVNGKKIRITEKHINNYLKKYNKNITVKMFRTWSANYILLKEILKYPLPETQKEAEKNVRIIVSKAADKMHHTKAVSKNSYMNNKLFEMYINNSEEFKNIIQQFKKSNGNLPTVDKLLTLFLKYFDENQ